MHAIRLHEFGPAENLRYEEIAAPEPGAGQVRIAVAASGVHLIDTAIRSGRSGGPFPLPELPTIPGREVAGTVEAVGDGIDAGWIGRRAVAHLGMAGGGYAERAVVGAASLHEVADHVGAEAAVAMIGTGRTAMGILELAELTAEDTVVVTAAAGGIGTLLVQAALRAGAEVVALAGGPEKVARARELGATVAVDYTDPAWPEQVRDALDGNPASVAFDSVGGTVGRGAMELLGAGGRLLLFGWSSGEPTPMSSMDIAGRGITAIGSLGARILQRPGGIRGLEDAALAAVTSGELVPVVDQTFALAEAAGAHRALETRATVGKVVLAP
ncbi:MAG TPA: zinc-binding dehydrogenase [Baekduia sp.]|uniref:zinc-binding dehydrogenase n=1 Tax=Baekduia sp. TaxID=2600305 RepID=UPI002BA2DEB5|nr:zinc-binding dehydrogenase [Baekduia sp.]HMJ36103.1 zinc-binding dehydrogenase [Baekduia sp.]